MLNLQVSVVLGVVIAALVIFAAIKSLAGQKNKKSQPEINNEK